MLQKPHARTGTSQAASRGQTVTVQSLARPHMRCCVILVTQNWGQGWGAQAGTGSEKAYLDQQSKGAFSQESAEPDSLV